MGISIRRYQDTCILLLGLVPVPAVCATAVATQSLNATVNPAWAMSVQASAGLTHGQQAFQPYQANVPLNYQVRTTPTGGGKITLQVTNDFAPAGGPSVSNGVLTYTCGSATLGSPCSGTQTASTAAQTLVVNLPSSACTGGGGACTAQDPNSVTLTFSLTDDPVYATGSYSAHITFTISAI